MAKFIIAACMPHCVDTHGGENGKTYWGGLSFSASPVIHPTKAKATQEAKKLAAINPDKAYIVFEAISSTVAAPSPTITQEYK